MNLHTAPTSSRLNEYFIVAGLAEDFTLLKAFKGKFEIDLRYLSFVWSKFLALA